MNKYLSVILSVLFIVLALWLVLFDTDIFSKLKPTETTATTTKPKPVQTEKSPTNNSSKGLKFTLDQSGKGYAVSLS